MINYILQVILFQVLFLAIYDLLLSKETFFTTNRWYLLGTSMVSFLLPFIKVPTFQQAATQEFLIVLPEIVLSPQKVLESSVEPAQLESSFNYLAIIFWVGIVVFAFIFLLKLFTILKLIFNNEKEKPHNITLVLLSKTSKAFSFFNYVFLGKLLKPEQKEKVIAHELVHTKQKHTLDLLYFEFLKIVMWFNPMVYLYQKRITLVHEYISDAIVANHDTKESYVDNLLASIFQVEHIGFVNQFYKESLLKKRIRMIMKTKSKKMNQLKYLLLIPVLGSMLFYVSCSEEPVQDTLLGNHKPEKKYQKRYLELDNEVIQGTSQNKTYMDFYSGFNEPEGLEISINDLTDFEKEEYAKFIEDRSKLSMPVYLRTRNIKLYRQKNGRNLIAVLFKKGQPNNLPKMEVKANADGSYSVLHVNKTPIFPGCNERDLDCFFKKLDNHFHSKFDKAMLNNLGLSKGKKKVYVAFNIDEKGNVADVKVRAPHKEIEKEVERILYELPQMTVGLKDNAPVKVKYVLPFVFYVD